MARDQYPAYFAEKLWEWLPAIYRELDGLEGGDTLRAFIESLADQAALLKRSQDRLWDDAYVELASDWAVPYIGELVGTRLVSSLNRRARRADVAKTIYYRRRKGTLAVLEQLIADIANWDGRVVEEMRRLARMRHGLDGPPRVGRLTHTPEGGLADLRETRGALLAGGAFDEFHYTPEMAPPAGATGRRGIPRLTFHLYRLRAVELHGVQPCRIKRLAGRHQGFTFDPSGRDVPLFSTNDPARNWSAWESAAEWSLPRGITCRLLNEASYVITTSEIAWILDDGPHGAPIASHALRDAAATDLRLLTGQRFDSAAALRRVLAGMPSAATLTESGVFAGLLERALVADCGRAAFFSDARGVTSVGIPPLGLSFTGVPSPSFLPRGRSCGGNLDRWTLTPPAGVDWVVSPEQGRFLLNPGNQALSSIRVRYHVGMLGPIGAGAYGREAVAADAPLVWRDGSSSDGMPLQGAVRIADSATYVNPPDQTALSACRIGAAEGERPYLRLINNWRLGAGVNNAELTLDGLWVGNRRASLRVTRSVVVQSQNASCNFERVVIRYCTLDPGGKDASGATLPPVALVISCSVEELVIENSILASIRLEGSTAAVNRLIIRDSIIHSRIDDGVALDLPDSHHRKRVSSVPLDLPCTHLRIERSTVVAPTLNAPAIRVERIHACDCLIVGSVRVADTQSGCFRFSARGPDSAVPRPYKSQTISDLPRLLTSTRFGDPHYLQLSPAAPPEIARGGENGGEMGAFGGQLLPIRQDGLVAKIHEFIPFGRLPNLIFEN